MFKKIIIVGAIALSAMGVFFSMNEEAVANNATTSQKAETDPIPLNVELLKEKIKAKLGFNSTKS